MRLYEDNSHKFLCACAWYYNNEVENQKVTAEEANNYYHLLGWLWAHSHAMKGKVK